MSQFTGRVYITINGQRLRSKEGAELNMGGLKREAAISDAGVDGFSESITAPKVECKLNHSADTKLAEYQAFKDGTLTFETDTGVIYTIINAFCEGEVKLNKGEISLSFSGTECLEG